MILSNGLAAAVATRDRSGCSPNCVSSRTSSTAWVGGEIVVDTRLHRSHFGLRAIFGSDATLEAVTSGGEW